jgi:ketosteroid isomerase-like protein
VPESSSQRNKAILTAANAAVARGDYDGFASFCTDDTEWTFVGDRTLRGKAAVREWMVTSYAEPPENTVTHLIAEGDYLTALGELSMTDRTGRVTRASYCDVWRLRDGKLAELRAFVVELAARP